MLTTAHASKYVFASVCMSLAIVSCTATGAVDAQYIRVENPTGWIMEFRQIEVFSGGKNVVLKRKELITGTVSPQKGDDHPTPESIIVEGARAAAEMTNGDLDTTHRSSEWRAYQEPSTNTANLNPWFEINLGKSMPIEKVVLYASRYPQKQYLDKGHRVVTLMNDKRAVIWAGTS